MADDGDGCQEVVHHRRQGLPEDGGKDLEGETGLRVSPQSTEYRETITIREFQTRCEELSGGSC